MPAAIEGLGLRSDEIVGRTILNVGSSHGNLCIAALEHGAARVLGVDIDLNRVQAAREKAIAGGQPKADFVQADFETWQSSEEFDLVICSNVLHQVLDPIHALRRMMRMARERIVVEFSPPALTDVRKFNVSLSGLLARGASLISPAFSRFNTEAYSRTFALTPSALGTLIDRHSNAFEPAQMSRSPQKGRYIATASRRRIDQLTVIAGPTSAGKGTLFRALDADLRSKLGIPLSDSGYVTASLARTLPPGRHSHVVLHYDMLRPFETSLHSYDRDLAVDLIRMAQRVTFLTIYADPERLQRQITASEIDSRNPGKQSHRHLKIRELYKDPGFIASWYFRWLEFCEAFREKTAGSFFLQNRGDYTILPATRETLASLLASTERNVGIQRDA
jgi:SAM-dependent methyltransferase